MVVKQPPRPRAVLLMRLRWWFPGLLAVACHNAAPEASPAPTGGEVSGVTVRASPPVTLRTIPIAEFVPLVSGPESGGQCEGMRIDLAPNGGRTVRYAFGSRTTLVRSVVVVFDSTGQPVRYSDLRGDLRGPRDASVSAESPLGKRTTIALDLVRMTAVLQNSDGETTEGFRVRGQEILSARSLGDPSSMIAQIGRECRQQ